MFQKFQLFIVISFFCSIERQVCVLFLATEAAIERCLKSSQDIPGHHMDILCTFSLNLVSPETANWLKAMQNHRKLLVNEFVLNKLQSSGLNFFKVMFHRSCLHFRTPVFYKC